MPILKRVKRCISCGLLLQSANPDYPGYIDEQILEDKDHDCMCNSCFEANKRKEFLDNEIDDDYFKLLKQIKKEKSLVVYVVDVFSFESSFISKINEYLEGCDVLAVGNKFDLLPKIRPEEEIEQYISHRMRIANLDVKDVLLTSVVKDYNIKRMYERIISLSSGRDVYFIGSSVSGKSALIQSLIKYFDNDTNEPIITHTFKDTNIRGFRIPLPNGNFMYETPGLPINNSMISKVELLVGHLIVPNEQIKPRTFKIDTGYSLLFGSLAMIQLINGKNQKIDVFCNNSIELKITKEGESEFGSTLIRRNLKPASKYFRSYSDFEVYDLDVVESGDRDIGILGLGWIKIHANNQVFRIIVPKGVSVYTTRSKL